MNLFLNRNVTILINRFLENIIPPIIRESKIFMFMIIYPAYGSKTKYLLEFKEKYPFMKEDELSHYYELIADAPINRKRMTDLNQMCITYIENNIKGKRILDAACGRGFLVKYIAKLKGENAEVTGVDLVVPPLPQKSAKNIHFLKGNLKSLPFENNSFDTVICTHALEHIPDYRGAIQELIRVAKQRIIIVMPCQREYKYTVDLHVNFCPYMYCFRKFIGVSDARYMKLGGDFLCIIEKQQSFLRK